MIAGCLPAAAGLLAVAGPVARVRPGPRWSSRGRAAASARAESVMTATIAKTVSPDKSFVT